MRHSILSAALAMCATTGAHAVQPSAADEAAGSEQNSANTVVCRRVPPPTGSRIGSRRVCKTEREWGIIARESRTIVEEAQNRSKELVSGE